MVGARRVHDPHGRLPAPRRCELPDADGAPGGDRFSLRGEFREVDPPARLAFTFAWEEPDPDDVETLVELSFEPVGQKTRLSLRQGRFKTVARRALHRDGWTDSLDKLERVVSDAASAGG